MRRPTPNQAKQVQALLTKFGPIIEASFLSAIQEAYRSINYDDLIAALDAKDLDRAAAMFKLSETSLYALEEAVRSTYVAGATAAIATLPSALYGKFGFNGRHVRAEAWIKSIGAELIQGITEDSLKSARSAILSSMLEGVGTKEISARMMGRVVGGQRVGGFLGLTSQQTDSIILGRSKLASGNPSLMREYLDLKLRSKRYDKKIERAIREGRAITGSELDEIISAHKSKAAAYRGKMIAENETFSAQAAGRDESYRQIKEREDVEEVTKRWQHNLSVNPREDHVAMSGTVVEMDEDFEFEDASMSHPHDRRGGAKHSIGCRCIVVYRIKVAKD